MPNSEKPLLARAGVRERLGDLAGAQRDREAAQRIKDQR